MGRFLDNQIDTGKKQLRIGQGMTEKELLTPSIPQLPTTMAKTKATIKPGPGVTETYGETPQQQMERSVQTESLKRQQKMMEDVSSVRNLLKVHVGAFRSLAKQAGGTGRFKGLQNWASGKLGELAPAMTGGVIPENPWVKAFKGNRNEIAVALARIASGGGRTPIRMVQMMKQTLAGQEDTQRELGTQVRLSLESALSRALGIKNKNSKHYKKIITAMYDDIMQTPAYDERNKGEIGELKKLEDGTTALIINGKPVYQQPAYYQEGDELVFEDMVRQKTVQKMGV